MDPAVEGNLDMNVYNLLAEMTKDYYKGVTNVSLFDFPTWCQFLAPLTVPKS